MSLSAGPSPLRRIILDEIAANGPIPFSRYMELCLYHPEFGYYSRAQEKFGKTGDFYTASDVHAVFGRLLCRQFDEMWRVLGSPAQIDLIEFGPGRGLFAQDVLTWASFKFPEFHQAIRYTLVESSPALRERLERQFGDGTISANKIRVLSGPPTDRAENAIVFANEFFDALPVEVVAHEGRLMIGERDERFIETFAPVPADATEFLDRFAVHPGEHERLEAIPKYREWMQHMANALDRGFVTLIDYGYSRSELLAGRHRGTITSFRRHTVSDSPYEAPGEQDITAHVNFTALQEIGKSLGLEAQPLITQSQFLLGIGESNQFADAFAECKLPQEHAKVTLQLKHLVTPAGMGENFQVQVFSRGVEPEKVARLSAFAFCVR